MLDKNIPILFPKELHHDDVASKLGVKSKVTSAGHVLKRGKLIKTYGKSYGFNLYPAPEDAEIIENFL